MVNTKVVTIDLNEMVGEVCDFIAAAGYKDMAEDLGNDAFFEIFELIAKAAVNSSFLNYEEYMVTPKNLFLRYDKNRVEFVDELVDEMYRMIQGELPPGLRNAGHFYFVEMVGSNLEVRLLVSAEAISYGFSIQPLIDLVV